jgi:hypothetical protein
MVEGTFEWIAVTVLLPVFLVVGWYMTVNVWRGTISRDDHPVRYEDGLGNPWFQASLLPIIASFSLIWIGVVVDEVMHRHGVRDPLDAIPSYLMGAGLLSMVLGLWLGFIKRPRFLLPPTLRRELNARGGDGTP